MTVKHWNTGASAERYRESKRASEHNKILKLHSIWLKNNGFKNWKRCEQASKEEKRGSVSVPIAKQGTS